MSSHGVPDVLLKKVDEYVDSLAPQIQPRIADELEVFQNKTIDHLESQVIDAFRSLFKDGRHEEGSSRGAPWDMRDGAPDSYGGQSLPFADEIKSLTRSFDSIQSEAKNDLQDVLNLVGDGGRRGDDEPRSRGGPGREDPFSQGARGFLSAAVDAVQDHLEHSNKGGGGGGGIQLDGFLGELSQRIKDTSLDPEQKAREISPQIKEKVAVKLREQHTSIAEQFTRLALEHLKRWLHGNTSSRDLGDGVKGEIEDQVKDLVKGIGGLFGHKNEGREGGSRALGDSDRGEEDGERGGGFSKLISDKLSTGLAKVHREVRLEFRKILGAIEKKLFELLPDEFQRPLERILGGNPFDSELDRDAGHSDRGLGSDLKSKLVSKIRDLVRKVQETLRASILAVVNGGHRKFERESWVFVQNIVEQKVQRYLPKVKISVPDDIGDEGVSVGAPTANAHLGSQSHPPSQGGGHAPTPSYADQNQQAYNQNSDYAPPPNPPYQEHRPDQYQQHNQEYRPPQQEYRPPQQDYYPQGQDYRPPQQDYRPPQQDYRPPQQDYRPPQQDYQPQQHQSHHGYSGGQDRPPQQYDPSQYQSNQSQNYQSHQGYQQHDRY